MHTHTQIQTQWEVTCFQALSAKVCPPLFISCHPFPSPPSSVSETPSLWRISHAWVQNITLYGNAARWKYNLVHYGGHAGIQKVTMRGMVSAVSHYCLETINSLCPQWEKKKPNWMWHFQKQGCLCFVSALFDAPSLLSNINRNDAWRL